MARIATKDTSSPQEMECECNPRVLSYDYSKIKIVKEGLCNGTSGHNSLIYLKSVIGILFGLLSSPTAAFATKPIHLEKKLS